MGGYGSGRQYGKPLAEESLRVELGWMLRNRRARPGQSITGNLSWSCRGEPSGNVSYTCDMRDADDAFLELRFRVTRRSTGEARDYLQRITLSYTVPHFGGRRWWMHCPVTGARVDKLYVPSGADTFASRKAWGIGYRSQRQTRRDNLFDRLFKLQERLGCPQGWEQPIWRPKGMHRKTFERFEEQYWWLDRQCGAEMMQVLARLQR